MAFIGECLNLLQIKAEVDRLFYNGSSLKRLLIMGETGTGKEELARYIHRNCFLNDNAPFVVLDSTTLNPNLVESQLFGHARGSFTGAVQDNQGLFQRSEGGTLFIDEVGELPLDLQVKLLRAIESQKFLPVGAKAEVECKTECILLATNRNLEEMVSAGKFRQDLWFRISSHIIRLPPLRERLEDIPCLIAYWLEHLNRECAREIAIEPDAILLLKSHFWPGNIRELRNVVERAYRTLEGNTITADHLSKIEANLRRCWNKMNCRHTNCAVRANPTLRCWEAEMGCCNDSVQGKALPEKLSVCTQCPHFEDYYNFLCAHLPHSPELFLWKQIKLFAEIERSRFNSDLFNRELPIGHFRKEWTIIGEREYLQSLLDRFGYDTNQIADHAGISQREVQRLLKKHGLGKKGDCCANKFK